MNDVMNTAGENCPAFGGAPEIYYIPVNDSDWLGYIRAIVDRGVSASLDTLAAWVALQQLPTDWSAGTTVEIDDIQVVAFSNSYEPGYHANALVLGFAGPPVQPTTTYKDSYDDARAAFDGGVNTTTWWTGTGLTDPQFPVGFRFLLLPVITGTVGLDSAALLMMYASLAGTLIPAARYVKDTGDTDVSGFLKDPPAPINPYAGTITPAGNTMTGLGIDPNGTFNMDLSLTSGATPFDYGTSDFADFIYLRILGNPTTCPSATVWMLTPCAAFAAFAPIYTTNPDVALYEIDDRAINVDGVCYTVNEITPGPATVSVTVCADSWVGGYECADCSNWLLTSCTDPADTMIVCQNFGASINNIVMLTGVGVDGCYSVAATNDAPDYDTLLILADACSECIDCLTTNLSIGLPLGNWDLVNSDIWSDNGSTAITDGGSIARIDSINGTCGIPTSPVLGNALNLTSADEYEYELDGITGKGPDAEAVGGESDAYLTVANDAAMNTGICTIYVAFATSTGGNAQDHIWSMVSDGTLTDGLGLIYDGTNLVAWGNDESNAAYKVALGVPTVDDISVIAVQFNSAGGEAGVGELKAQWTSGGALTGVSCPWVNPASDLILGGTPDNAGNPPKNTARGRLYQVLYFDEVHSAAEITAIITEMETKFNIP